MYLLLQKNMLSHHPPLVNLRWLSSEGTFVVAHLAICTSRIFSPTITNMPVFAVKLCCIFGWIPNKIFWNGCEVAKCDDGKWFLLASWDTRWENYGKHNDLNESTRFSSTSRGDFFIGSRFVLSLLAVASPSLQHSASYQLAIYPIVSISCLFMVNVGLVNTPVPCIQRGMQISNLQSFPSLAPLRKGWGGRSHSCS